MLKTELQEIISNGESSYVEFKEDAVDSDKLARAVVAFANGNGGKILLGVRDNGDICGITRDDLQSWLMDTVIHHYVHPMLIPFYEEIEMDFGGERKRVAVLDVPMGAAKPYVVKNKGRQDVYIRIGDTNRLATREQHLQLFESGGLLSVENLPVQESDLSELDMRRLEEYFLEIIEDEVEGGDWEKKLLLRELLKSLPGVPKPCCTIAACMLFGKEPRRRTPQAGVRVMVFAGKDVEENDLLDEVLDIPFLGLHEKNARDYIEQSIPYRVISYIRQYISRQKIEGMYRRRHWDYPEDVIRELLVNAFAHRDWTRPNDVRLVVFSDRIEITSPGALPNHLTIEKIKAGQQVPRNTNVVRILRDYGFMEYKGMGIRRKVIPGMRECNGTEPKFEATEDYFRVTLYKDNRV